MPKPFVITFAGAPGTGKTPIAFHLSYTFNLPIIQMDAIRLEVREDMLEDDNNKPAVRAEFLRRAEQRYQALLGKKLNFIDDSSADRSWKQKPGDQFYQLQTAGYDCFMISMDLSKEFIARLHGANHSLSADALDSYFEQHQMFLEQYGSDANLHITDETYKDRMALSEQALAAYLQQRA